MAVGIAWPFHIDSFILGIHSVLNAFPHGTRGGEA